MVMVAELVEDVNKLLADGTRALRRHGDLHESRRSFDRAYELATQTGDHYAMSMSVLGSGGLWVHEHRSAESTALLQARLSKALSLVDPRSPVGVQLRARLAGESDYRTGEYAKVLAVLDEARQIADPVVLADTLSIAHHCLLGPDHGGLRRDLASDLVEESVYTRRRSDLLMGVLWQTVDQFLDGDPHAERRLRELRELLRQHDHLAVGFVADAIETMLAIRTGEFERAEVLANACVERGTAAGDLDAAGWHAAQLLAIRWYQGRIAELLPMLDGLAHSPTLSSVDNSLFAALAVAAAKAGDLRTAAGALAVLSSRDLAGLPRSSTWLVTMNGVIEAAHILGDTAVSTRAYELLRPYGDMPMMASLGVACFGSVQHALGVASLTNDDVEKAVGHLRAAVHQNLALGHWPAVVMSRIRYAEALIRQGEPSDAAAAQVAMATAEEEAKGMGMPIRVDGVRGSSDLTATFTRQGQTWKVEVGHRSVVVEHSVGMLHLAVLVANPGQEIPSADLVAGVAELSKAAARVSHSAQPILDRAAIRQYRDRLSQLSLEIAECEARNDEECAAAARVEQTWLMRELAAAAGIGGDTRRFPDGHERARIAVGKAIRRAIARVQAADVTIGQHLRRSVHTGVRCSYRHA